MYILRDRGSDSMKTLSTSLALGGGCDSEVTHTDSFIASSLPLQARDPRITLCGSDTPETFFTSPPAKQSLCAQKIPDRKHRGAERAPFSSLVPLPTRKAGSQDPQIFLTGPPPPRFRAGPPSPKASIDFCPRLFFSAAGTAPPTPLLP